MLTDGQRTDGQPGDIRDYIMPLPRIVERRHKNYVTIYSLYTPPVINIYAGLSLKCYSLVGSPHDGAPCNCIICIHSNSAKSIGVHMIIILLMT